MKTTYCLGAAALFLSILALPGSSDCRQSMVSSTKAVIIDGKRFHVETSVGDDSSLIRRELSRRGLDLPVPGVPQSSTPYFADALQEDNGTTSSPSIPVPQGLHAEHVVRMESNSGPVDLAVGFMEAHGRSVRAHLASSGWKIIEDGHGRDRPAVATMKTGRETFIVFLEEKKGRFLLVRKRE